MPGVEGGILFPPDKLRAFTLQVFQKVGVSPEDAEIVTDSLIEANLRGVDTHGITRVLGVYIKRIQAGVMSPRTELEVVRENASTALIDCKNSIGQVAATRAMQLAIKKARETGTMPAIVVIAVIKMGRKRIGPACKMAAVRSRPRARS